MAGEKPSEIGIEEFAKIDLRVGVVLEAERIEGTRLIRLVVDLGSEKRQIIAGIGEWYEPSSSLNDRVWEAFAVTTIFCCTTSFK